MIAFDLDDTLYKERDFCRSAYRAVCRHLGLPESFAEAMSQALAERRNPFDTLAAMLGRPLDIPALLEVYRFHKPQIAPSPGALETLRELRERGERLALVTDGRSLTQRNKIAALGLAPLFDDIVISEEFGEEKSTGAAFRLLAEKRDRGRLLYVGDNPAKDVEASRLCGFTPVLLLDTEGVNIHPQTLPEDANVLKVTSLPEILNL